MAIHFPRRFTLIISTLFRDRAQRNAVRWLRKIPERISQLLRFNVGRISINRLLYKFAVMMWVFCAAFHLRTSAN
jgi:hypothetical protein